MSTPFSLILIPWPGVYSGFGFTYTAYAVAYPNRAVTYTSAAAIYRNMSVTEVSCIGHPY